MKSISMVQVADRRLELEEVEIPRVRAFEGLLRVEACGLCGSDVEQYRGNFAKKGLATYPVIPGHEPVGIIEEIGDEASQLWGVRAGDRVALEPHLTCGRCEVCNQGDRHLCKTLAPDIAAPVYGYLPKSFGHGLWGGYGQYIHLHERTRLHKLPDALPSKISTMYQLIASGIRWAVDIPETRYSDTALVLGCGQRGLGAVVALKAAGVSTIIITGTRRSAFKLEVAKKLGATHTIVVDEEDTVERVMQITSNRGVDVSLDVTPSAAGPINDAIRATRPTGRVVLAGIKGGDKLPPIDTDQVIYREIKLMGAFTQSTDAYARAIDILCRDPKAFELLKTHEVSLEEADHALRMVGGEIPDLEAICVSLHPPKIS